MVSRYPVDGGLSEIGDGRLEVERGARQSLDKRRDDAIEPAGQAQEHRLVRARRPERGADRRARGPEPLDDRTMLLCRGRKLWCCGAEAESVDVGGVDAAD